MAFNHGKKIRGRKFELAKMNMRESTFLYGNDVDDAS